jgi:hypothetical protein
MKKMILLIHDMASLTSSTSSPEEPALEEAVPELLCALYLTTLTV